MGKVLNGSETTFVGSHVSKKVFSGKHKEILKAYLYLIQSFKLNFGLTLLTTRKFAFQHAARHAGSDGSMSASGSAGPGSIPGRVVNFHFKIFNLGARRGGDVHFLIARLYITVLD